MNDVKIPPIIGAAILRITSEPALVDHMIGTKPVNITATVMTFGRNRFTAPSWIACFRSAMLRISPLAFRSLNARSRVEQHEDCSFRIDSQERDQPNPNRDTHVVVEEVEEPDRSNRRERHS